jgi:hypothetical protein
MVQWSREDTKKLVCWCFSATLSMGENQRIEKLLQKMSQFLKEIDKLKQPKKSVEIPKQSGKQ